MRGPPTIQREPHGLPKFKSSSSNKEQAMATEAEIHDLLEKMREERARFVAQARTLTEDEAARRPEGKTGEEEWSAKEQLAHMWEMERNYVAWVRRALEEDGADLTGVHGERPAITIERANEHS